MGKRVIYKTVYRKMLKSLPIYKINFDSHLPIIRYVFCKTWIINKIETEIEQNKICFIALK